MDIKMRQISSEKDRGGEKWIERGENWEIVQMKND